MSLFKLRGKLTKSQTIILGILGLVIFLLGWWLLAEVFSVEVGQEANGPGLAEEEVPSELPEERLKLVDLDPRPNRLAEHSAEGTLVPVQVSVEGLDTGSAVFFRLLDNGGGAFSIQPLNGQISVLDPEQIDYEQTTSYNLPVNAELPDGRTGSANFIIQLEDLNEFEVDELRDANVEPNKVRKGKQNGSNIGLTAFAQDPDGTDQVRYRLLDNPGELFAIDAVSGDVFLNNSAALDSRPEGPMYVEIEGRSEDGSTTSARFQVDILVASDQGEEEAGAMKKVYPILPTPVMVLLSYPSLVKEDELMSNTGKSIWLNFKGYFWAVLISVPLGFLIGLLPIFRGLFSKQVNALRYLPLTALTGLFIIWFGIEDQMKVSFLAFGIIVYLLPVVVQRIDEVNEVYTQTVFTLSANTWQTIRTVFLPSVMSKLIDDIRVLTAISWTYIIIAELVNRQGGVGSLIYIKARQGQISKVFAILIIIVLIGFIQDRIFVYLDKRLFPHKYYKTTLSGIREVEYGILAILIAITAVIFQQLWLPAFNGGFGNIAVIVLLSSLIIIGYGELKVRTALRKAS